MVDIILFYQKPCYNWQPSYCLGLDMTSFFFQKMIKENSRSWIFHLYFFGKKKYPGEKNSQKRKEKKLVMRIVQGIKKNN